MPPFTIYAGPWGPQIVRTIDGAFIPADMANKDYRDYENWIAAGSPPAPWPLPSIFV